GRRRAHRYGPERNDRRSGALLAYRRLSRDLRSELHRQHLVQSAPAPRDPSLSLGALSGQWSEAAVLPSSRSHRCVPISAAVVSGCERTGPGPSFHPGFLAALGDDGLAVVEVPGAHSSLDIEGVEAVLVQPGDGAVRASAGAADDVHVVVERQVVEAGGQFAQRLVVRAFDVPGFTLVVFTDVDDGGTFGNVVDGDGGFFIHGPSVGTGTTAVHPVPQPP